MTWLKIILFCVLYLHLSDAFIQSDLLFRLYIYFCQYMCSLGIEPTTFALLTQCSTTEPLEHSMCLCGLRLKNTLFSTYYTLLSLLYAPPF